MSGALQPRGLGHNALLLALCSAFACTGQAAPTRPSTPDAGNAPATADAQVAPQAGAAGERVALAGTLAASSGSGSGGASAAVSGMGGTRSTGPGAAGSAADAGVHDAAAQSECGLCKAYAAPKTVGTVKPAALSALSGLAVSRSQPDIFFAHNDHDRPVVYALDLQGQLHARVTLEAAESRDIEDIAVGKCDTQTCVYLADVGDNAATSGEYGILRFIEPEVPSMPGSAELTPSFERLRFRYEDGSHNAESLLVAPDGTLYIVTKLAPGSGGSVEATGPSSVYRIAASAFAQSAVAQASKVTTLSVPQAGEPALSAAAAHPCGLGFLARTYDRVYEFLVPPGAAFEAAFAATPQVVAMPDEPQSEAVDYQADGRGFVTSGEGMSAPIVLTQCAP